MRWQEIIFIENFPTTFSHKLFCKMNSTSYSTIRCSISVHPKKKTKTLRKPLGDDGFTFCLFFEFFGSYAKTKRSNKVCIHCIANALELTIYVTLIHDAREHEHASNCNDIFLTCLYH